MRGKEKQKKRGRNPKEPPRGGHAKTRTQGGPPGEKQKGEPTAGEEGTSPGDRRTKGRTCQKERDEKACPGKEEEAT